MKKLLKFFEDLYHKTQYWKNKINIQYTFECNSFGCYDTKLEAWRPGYYTNEGKMKYGKPIFDVWGAPIAIGTWSGERKFYVSSLFAKGEVVSVKTGGVIYSEQNKHTGNKRYFIGSISEKRYIESEAYEKFGKIIKL
jgi:hypothetical protein